MTIQTHSESTFTVEVLRQASSQARPYWERYVVKLAMTATLLDLLFQLQRHPVIQEGRAVNPLALGESLDVVGDSELVVRYNGQPVIAGFTKLPPHGGRIILEPSQGGRVLRDLWVERPVPLAWAPQWMDGIDQGQQSWIGSSSVPWAVQADWVRCIGCGICDEVCPSRRAQGFEGPRAVIHDGLLQDKSPQAHHDHWTVKGLGGCLNAGACGPACPLDITVTEAMARAKRQGLWSAIKEFLG